MVRSHKLSCHSGIAGTFTYWKLTGVLVGRTEVGGMVGCHEDGRLMVRNHINYISQWNSRNFPLFETHRSARGS